VQEAVDRLLSYEEWFSQEVDKGLAAADEGEFVEHDDVRRMIETRYPA
jgi:predicted transcriptional regulator